MNFGGFRRRLFAEPICCLRILKPSPSFSLYLFLSVPILEGLRLLFGFHKKRRRSMPHANKLRSIVVLHSRRRFGSFLLLSLCRSCAEPFRLVIIACDTNVLEGGKLLGNVLMFVPYDEGYCCRCHLWYHN